MNRKTETGVMYPQAKEHRGWSAKCQRLGGGVEQAASQPRKDAALRAPRCHASGLQSCETVIIWETAHPVLLQQP